MRKRPSRTRSSGLRNTRCSSVKASGSSTTTCADSDVSSQPGAVGRGQRQRRLGRGSAPRDGLDLAVGAPRHGQDHRHPQNPQDLLRRTACFRHGRFQRAVGGKDLRQIARMAVPPRSTVPMPPFSPEQIAFLEGPNSLVIATQDGKLVPEVTRALALRCQGTDQVVVWLPVRIATRALANLKHEPRIAVGVSRPSSHQTFQLKGRALRVAEAPPRRRSVWSGRSRRFIAGGGHGGAAGAAAAPGGALAGGGGRGRGERDLTIRRPDRAPARSARRDQGPAGRPVAAAGAAAPAAFRG